MVGNASQILVEKSGHVAILTLNRPSRLNTFTRQMTLEFEAALNAGRRR